MILSSKGGADGCGDSESLGWRVNGNKEERLEIGGIARVLCVKKPVYHIVYDPHKTVYRFRRGRKHDASDPHNAIVGAQLVRRTSWPRGLNA